MTLSDPELGLITVTVNTRARRIIMRAEVGGLRVTAPFYATKTDIISAINKFRETLKQKQNNMQEVKQPTAEEIETLRKSAKTILPQKVAELAARHGFTYQGLKIQSSKTRWGSCSGRNSINLSLYVMRLPEHLQEYVILHELCHTVHHDHSPHFWALMDKVTGGKAHQLNKEIKNYHTI